MCVCETVRDSERMTDALTRCAPLQINPAFWVAFTQEEMINSLNVDEGVMGEIDSLLSAVTSAPQ